MSSANISPARHPRLAPLPIARWANWFVGLAALALIGMSLGAYFYHRRQMDSIAARHMRLVLAGPGRLQTGAPSVYSLLTTRVTGEPWPAPVEWSLSTPDGKRLVDHKETSEQGRLVMVVPADMALPARLHAALQLNVTADHDHGYMVSGESHAVSMTLPLAIRPAQYTTHLEIDRDHGVHGARYRPGETVYYRSLTVSRYSLAADRTLPLEFEILDPKSAPLADSQWIGLTDHGAGNGSFALPVSLSAGTYALVARGADDAFPPQRLAFEVTGAATPPAPAEKPAAKKPAGKDAVRIDFFPEGGTLAAGLENRVFFSARNAQGQPLDLRGDVVNSRGDRVARLETSASGRGTFDFVPNAADSYRVKIEQPADLDVSPLLPQASSEQNVVITAEHGVLAPGSPLELSVRATRKDIPLVVTARAGGLLIGQQPLVTSAEAAKGMSVTIPLDDAIAGAIRVTVYDDSKCPPKVVAERLVYRQPRRLIVRVAEATKPSGELVLSVQDEKGRPVAAALSVTALGRAPANAPEARRPQADLLHSLLLDADVPNKAALESLDLQSPDADAQRNAIDLALGCQKLHPPLGSQPGEPDTGEAEGTPLAVYDNLGELRDQYEAMLSEYRAQRTQVVNALIMLSFFGGLALALLVTMLALLRIVWGSQLWLPTIIATLCCVIVTGVSNDPSRMKPVEVAAVGFAPCSSPQTGTAAQTPAAPAAAPSSESKLRSLAEKLAKSEGDPEELKVDRFPVQHYASPDMARPLAADNGGKPLAWYPLLITAPDGRVTVPGITVATGKTLRLMIEAHGNGRIESCELSP